MIYFDNAATTRQKPQQVLDAVMYAMTSFGGVGRGVHEASLAAGMTVYEAREKLAQLFNAPNPSRVSFCLNATEALNIALLGLLNEGDHVITTNACHNSVRRPLLKLQREGVIQVDFAPIGTDGGLDMDAVRALVRPNTRLFAMPHASNLTGDVYDIEALGAMAHECGALMLADVAQTAGVIPIDMAAQHLDVVCYTGHKSLYGPQGTGGVVLAEGVECRPLKVGGSGIHSYDTDHPRFMPEVLEAGTLNGHGIAGLAAGVDFIMETGIQAIYDHEMELVHRLESGIRSLDGVKLYGGGASDRTGIVCMNIGSMDSGEVSDALRMEADIATRSGAHCAPLMHEALGTVDQGAVRFSFSWFNTVQEVDVCIEAIKKIAGAWKGRSHD